MAGIARRAHPELAERLGMDWIGPLDRLPELLRVSDYLFLCLPLTEETRRLIDAAALAQLPEGACLINVGRGGVVDHAALLAALDSGRLLGAGLDVFDHEPLDPQSPLLTRPNVLATPHVAGVTDASYRGIAARVTANIRRLVNGEPLRGLRQLGGDPRRALWPTRLDRDRRRASRGPLPVVGGAMRRLRPAEKAVLAQRDQGSVRRRLETAG